MATCMPSIASSITAAISASGKRRPVRPAARPRGRAGSALLFDLRHRGLLPGAPRDQAGAAHAGLRAWSRSPATAGPSQIARNASDIERIHKSGKIAAVLDIEGSFDLDGDLAVLREMYRLGLAVRPAFGAQLDQQLCGFLLLARQMARPERTRPGVRSRDEPPGHGDQCFARFR